MKNWLIEFEENGGEFVGTMVVTAKEIIKSVKEYGYQDSFIADGVYIKMDERIISISEIKED